MFSFASKVLNTLIGDEEQQQQQQNAQGVRPGGILDSHPMQAPSYRPQGVPMRPGMPSSGPGGPSSFVAPFSSHDHPPSQSPYRYGAPIMPTPQRMSSPSSNFGSFQQQRPLRPSPQPSGGLGRAPSPRFGTPGDCPEFFSLPRSSRHCVYVFVLTVTVSLELGSQTPVTG